VAVVTTGIGSSSDSGARRAQLEALAWRLAPLWTGVASLLLNICLLGRQSLRAEEAQALVSATGSWDALWSAIRGHESPHALYETLLRPWLALAGTDEWALRLPAAVCGALAVGLTCLLAARLLGRAAGLVAAGVLATSVVFVDWSQRGDGTALALVAGVAATVALVSALERPAWWRWALWAMAAALAVAVSLLSVSVVVAHVAAFLLTSPRPPWRAPAVALGAVGLVAAASSVLVLASDAVRLGELGLPEAEPSGEGLWRLIGATPVPLAVAGLGVFVLVTSRIAGAATWKTVLLCTWLVVPVALGLLVSLARPAFDPGYAIVAVPALALLVAAGVVSQQRWIALGLVALLVLGASFRLGEWYTGPSGENWRDAVAAIRAEQQAGEAVVVLPRRDAVAAAYYAGDGFAIERARGHRVWLLVTTPNAEQRLELGRALVRPPRYALLDERRYGEGLWLQVWAEP
jgi:mannosyltransferase